MKYAYIETFFFKLIKLNCNKKLTKIYIDKNIFNMWHEREMIVYTRFQ